MLRQSSGGISGLKYIIDCGDKISQDHPTTKGWLENLTYLKSIKPEKQSMTHKKILEGILNSKDSVVVKVADTSENIKIEYDTYEKLRNAKVYQGIAHYYCYFECNDDIKRITHTPHICQGTGSTMRVLVMEHIKNPSFQEYNWKPVDKETIKSCIKQVLCTALDAYLKTGFVHGDLHLKNVLLKPTKSTEIDYGFVKVPMGKFKTYLMDFEFSKFHQHVDQFHKHNAVSFISSIRRCIGSFDFINKAAYSKLAPLADRLWDKSKDPMDTLQLFDIIDHL